MYRLKSNGTHPKLNIGLPNSMQKNTFRHAVQIKEINGFIHLLYAKENNFAFIKRQLRQDSFPRYYHSITRPKQCKNKTQPTKYNTAASIVSSSFPWAPWWWQDRTPPSAGCRSWPTSPRREHGDARPVRSPWRWKSALARAAGGRGPPGGCSADRPGCPPKPRPHPGGSVPPPNGCRLSSTTPVSQARSRAWRRRCRGSRGCAGGGGRPGRKLNVKIFVFGVCGIGYV